MSSQKNPKREIYFNFNISSSNPNVLEGLEKWLKLGLYTPEEVKRIAHTYLKCDIQHFAKISIDNPNFLEILETGLNLGLISHDEVKRVARNNLVCAYDNSPKDIKEIFTPIAKIPVKKKKKIPQLVNASSKKQVRKSPVIKPPTKPKKPSIVTTFLKSFKDELSVRWLLFLGVFLVVLSSGVLAATQWNKFDGYQQYGVLLSYTLAFWGVGFYSGKQDNLKLTAQTLQTITLLLTPVNFWAIDTFNLWDSFVGGVIALFAVLSLTAITIISNGERSYLPLVINFLGLSLLHLGWEIKGFPLIAVYIGMIATAFNLRFILPRQVSASLSHKPLTLIKTSFVSYGLIILLARAIFVAQISIPQLGLAIAICGWLLTLEGLGKNVVTTEENKSERERRNQIKQLQSPSYKGLESSGATLMIFGWIVTVSNIAIQAILISGLILHWLWLRLTTYWLKKDLFWLFVVGLQGLILIRNLIPTSFKETALNLSIEIAQSHDFPYTVYSLTLFPYLLFFVLLTQWLYNKDKTSLARFGEWLSFYFGIALTSISIANPTWRSLNLILSTSTLVYINFCYRNKKALLINFTHLIGLITIVSCVNWLFPQLSYDGWILISLGVMVAELSIAHIGYNQKYILDENTNKKIKRKPNLWYQSCLYYFLLQGLISYFLISDKYNLVKNQIEFLPQILWWFITPISLTFFAFISKNQYGKKNQASLSLFSLTFALSLTVFHPLSRFISIAIATVLIFINSYLVEGDNKTQKILIYINHIFILATLVCGVNYFYGDLSWKYWGMIFLGGNDSRISLKYTPL